MWVAVKRISVGAGRLIAAAPMMAVALVFVVGSMAMNYTYWTGLGVASGVVADVGGVAISASLVLGVMSIAADAGKAVLPIYISNAVDAGKWRYALTCRLIFALCMIFALIAALGFVSQTRSAASMSAGEAAATLRLVRRDLAAIEAQLSVVQVQVGSDTLEQQRRWKSTAGCTNATVPASERFCATYNAAIERERLERQRSELRANEARLVRAGGDADVDPQGATLVRIVSLFGLDLKRSDVDFWLVVFFACFVEVCAAASFYIAAGFPAVARASDLMRAENATRHVDVTHNDNVTRQKPVTRITDVTPANDVKLKSEPQLLPPPKPGESLAEIDIWLVQMAEPATARSKTTIGDMRTKYLAWCEVEDREPVCEMFFRRAVPKILTDAGLTIGRGVNPTVSGLKIKARKAA